MRFATKRPKGRFLFKAELFLLTVFRLLYGSPGFCSMKSYFYFLKYTDPVLKFAVLTSSIRYIKALPVRYQSKMSILRFVTDPTFSRSEPKPNSILLWYLTGRVHHYPPCEKSENFKPDQYNIDSFFQELKVDIVAQRRRLRNDFNPFFKGLK